MVSVAEFAEFIASEEVARAARRAAKPTKDAKAAFRSSIAWRRLRYAALAENAAKNNGTARCELCGKAGTPDASLHVDHVEAVSKNWARRLDRTNLQVLCEDCNVGKLDGPAADFRRSGG
ncbi:MAG TPA: HNH endonuclease signature motif containing protein [Acetobacteraceae bacterium]|nr:HNH endonuclease signature motif containing protein [Acetobacteraceae bacterium]